MAMRHATPDGTANFRKRFLKSTHSDHYQQFHDLWISSLGIAIHPPRAEDSSHLELRDAVLAGVMRGCNLIDSIHSHQSIRGEVMVGRALNLIFSSGDIEREQLIVCSHGGQVLFHGEYPQDAHAYVRQNMINAGFAAEDEFSQGWHHCIAPKFLREQFQRSLTTLGLGTLDIYFLHNPEIQRVERGPDVFEHRIRAAFAELESQVNAGRLVAYGLTTDSGLRVRRGAPEHISIERLVQLAEEVTGSQHHLKYIQAPLNLVERELVELSNQVVKGRVMTSIEAAQEVGLAVLTTSPLLGGELARIKLSSVTDNDAPDWSSAQKAIQYPRTTKGVTSSIFSVENAAQVAENTRVSRLPRAT